MEIKKVAHLKGHAGGVFAMENGRAPHLVFSGSSDKMIAEWSLMDFVPQNFAVKTESFVYSICHIPSKNLLIAGLYSGAIHVIDLNTKREIKFFAYHNQPVFDIKYCAHNNMIYALCGDGSFSVWDGTSFALRNHFLLCRSKLRSIDFTVDGSMAALACGDGFVRIFNLSSHERIAEIEAHSLSANCVKFHPDGKTLISGGRDAYLRFWDIKENFKMITEIPAHNYAVYQIAFCPDGTLFATASRDRTAKIWDAETLKLIARLDKKSFDGHTHSVNKLLWTSYKDYLVTAGDDRTIIVWKVNR